MNGIEENAMIGRVFAFRGDYETMENNSAIVELTDVTADGLIELGFDGPNRQRIYVAVNAGDLMLRATKFARTK